MHNKKGGVNMKIGIIDEMILGMVKEGATISEMAIALKVHRNTVYGHIKKLVKAGFIKEYPVRYEVIKSAEKSE